MNRLFVTTLFLIAFSIINQVISAHPDDRNTLYVYVNSSDMTQSFSLDNLDKITFSENSMKLWEYSGTTEIDFSTFSFLSFDKDINPTTSVRDLSFGKDVKIQYVPKSNVVTVEAKEPLNGVAIYDLQGRLLTSASTASQSYRISVAKIPRGIFVVRVTCGGKVKSHKMVK